MSFLLVKEMELKVPLRSCAQGEYHDQLHMPVVSGVSLDCEAHVSSGHAVPRGHEEDRLQSGHLTSVFHMARFLRSWPRAMRLRTEGVRVQELAPLTKGFPIPLGKVSEDGLGLPQFPFPWCASSTCVPLSRVFSTHSLQ